MTVSIVALQAGRAWREVILEDGGWLLILFLFPGLCDGAETGAGADTSSTPPVVSPGPAGPALELSTKYRESFRSI